MVDFDELTKIQRQMAGRLMQEADTDHKLLIMDVIRDLSGSRNKKVQVEQVIIEAGERGVGEEECLRMLDELIDFGYLTTPEDGYVKRT